MLGKKTGQAWITRWFISPSIMVMMAGDQMQMNEKRLPFLRRASGACSLDFFGNPSYFPGKCAKWCWLNVGGYCPQTI